MCALPVKRGALLACCTVRSSPVLRHGRWLCYSCSTFFTSAVALCSATTVPHWHDGGRGETAAGAEGAGTEPHPVLDVQERPTRIHQPDVPSWQNVRHGSGSANTTQAYTNRLGPIYLSLLFNCTLAFGGKLLGVCVGQFL